MIGRLRGTLVHREPGAGVIDVGGVGYLVHAPQRCLDGWAGSEEDVTAWISTQVREDAITLYGFASFAERDAFQVLMTVTGVGPKMALAALDTLGIDALAQAIDAEDLGTLSRVPGVGKKMAQRLTLELKGKLRPAFAPTRVRARPVGPPDPLPLALARLDYGKSEIDRALFALADQGLTRESPLEDRLRAALRVLSA